MKKERNCVLSTHRKSILKGTEDSVSDITITDYKYKFIDFRISNFRKKEILLFESLECLLDFYFDEYDKSIALMD